MKRSRKVLAWIVGVVLAFVLILIVLIATFDWNRIKPFINDKVSQAIGRPFAINGNLGVDWRRERDSSGAAGWLPWPEFTARDIRIANPGWAAQAQFAQLDALHFRLSPWALLMHRIEVPSVQLVNPNIDLEHDKDGRATWQFNPPAKTEPSAWHLEVGSVGFDRGVIRLDDAVTQTKLKVTVKPLQQAIPYDDIVAQQTADARKQAQSRTGKPVAKAPHDARPAAPGHATSYQFAWEARGTYQGGEVSGKGKTGAVLALQDSGTPFPLQADVHIGDSHIALVGTLTDPLQLGALDLRLRFSGSSMARLYPLTGITLPDTPPYATEGHLTAKFGDGGSRYHYQDFRGHVGGSDLSGDLLFVTGGERPKLSGKLHSDLLRFADLAPLIGADAGTAKADRPDAAQATDTLLPNAPFRTDRWQTMDANVDFSASRIEHGKALPIDSLQTHLVLSNGALYLDPLNFGVAGGNVRSNITLDGSREPMHGLLKLHARHLKLKQLFPSFEPMRTSFGEINGDADLSAEGNSIAALLGSADGELKLLMNDGAISKTLLETAGLNVGNIIIGKLFGDKTVEINCAATDMVARDGVFDLRLFVFDTDDAVIKVDGTVNLATEQLDLDVQPHTKGLRILSLRSPLYVKGTLKHPDVGVKKGPLLLRGAGAIALGTVAAPAAALLALIAPSHEDKDSGENTCRAVLAELHDSGKKAPPAKD